MKHPDQLALFDLDAPPPALALVPARRLPIADPPTGPGLDAVAELESPYVEDGPSCVRSPCDTGPVWDPKASQEEILAARALVGTPKLRRAILRVDREVIQGAFFKSGPKKGQPKTRPIPVWQETVDYNRPGSPAWPLAVSYGIGIDSTAVLVGLVQLYRETRDERYRPHVITFADTGAEKQSTYAYLAVINPWLERSGFPPVTVVAWAQQFDPSKSWGSHRTLEQKCLNNHTVPSITASGFKKSECSITWKHEPQNYWFRHYSGLYEQKREHNTKSQLMTLMAAFSSPIDMPHLAKRAGKNVGTVRAAIYSLRDAGLVMPYKHVRGMWELTNEGIDAVASGSLMDVRPALPPSVRIVKAIGYDATETERLDPDAKGSTFRVGSGGGEELEDYVYWYPLMEWGWDRARCYAEIEAEVGVVPPKSSCFFCGAMKAEEVRALSRDDLRRAIFMEQVALRGRHSRGADSGLKGLAFAWAWTDYVLGRVTPGMGEREREQIRQFGQLMSEQEVAELTAAADAWIAASPPAKGAFDVAAVGESMSLTAYTDVRGVRGAGPIAGWDVFVDRQRQNPPMPHDPLIEGSV